MWPQRMAFICYDPTALLQIMQVRWDFPHWLLGGVVLISGTQEALQIELEQNGSNKNSAWEQSC